MLERLTLMNLDKYIITIQFFPEKNNLMIMKQYAEEILILINILIYLTSSSNLMQQNMKYII